MNPNSNVNKNVMKPSLPELAAPWSGVSFSSLTADKLAPKLRSVCKHSTDPNMAAV